MSNSLRRLILATALLLAVAPALARAQQCTITGPATFCGATATLCGPGGGLPAEWSGPGIVAINGSCIVVSVPGTYTLTTFDPSLGRWTDPCSFTLARGTPPVATITGPVSGCDGASVRLCGPGGTLTHQWTGPNGFSAATPCIDVTVAGDYSLVVSDDASGCTSDPVVQSVSFGPCGGGTGAVSCPRSAAWWSRACAGSVAGVDAGVLAAVATCVDEHAASLDWSGDAGAFARTLRTHPGDLRSRAVRQFTAVLANTCAGPAGVTAAGGPVGLDPATPLSLPGVSGTVGDWLAATDARLALLALRRHQNQGVAGSYRDIIRTGWEIAHGHGIGTVCATDSGMTLADRGRTAMEDEPLAAELSDAGEVSLTRVDLAQNPARGAARMSLAVSDPTTDLVVGVYDLTGRLVRELAHGSYPAGTFDLSWDGRDANGVAAPNGVYFVQTRIGGERSQTRLTLLR